MLQKIKTPLTISIHAPRTGSDYRLATHPARREISIHAPRTGSDGLQRRKPDGGADFNPRSPHGERLRAYRAAQFVAQISIHAPRTGSDISARTGRGQLINFNPRSPHGERPCRHRPRLDGQQDFNPRSPHGERQLVCLQFNVSEISIHAPRTGSDFAPVCDDMSLSLISIHAPRTGSDRHTRLVS